MKRILAGFAGMLLVASIAYAQQSFTLEQAIQYALENQTAIKLANIEVADAEGQLVEYKSTGIPKVNGSLVYNYFPQVPQFLIPKQFIDPDAPEGSFALLPAGTEQTIAARIEFSAILADAAWIVGLRAQRMYREMILQEGKATASDVKANVRKAYLAVLIAQKNKEILDLNIANLTKTLHETREIYANGFAEKLDVDRLELSLNNLKAESEKISRLLFLGHNILKFQMSYPLESEIIVEDKLDDLIARMTIEATDLNERVDFSLRPEYAAINLGEELAKINIKRYRLGYIPTLNAFGSHQQQLQRNDLFSDAENGWFGTTVVGLSLNVPIFDGLEKSGKIQRARILLDKTRIQKSEFERAVTLEVRNARASFMNAQQSVETTRNSLALAQRIYDTTQIKFKEGVGSSVELAQAERELYAAQSNHTNALYDLLIAKSDLERALGKM